MDINETINAWRDVFTKPAEVFKAEKKKANLMDGAKMMAIAFAIAAVLQIIWGVISQTFQFGASQIGGTQAASAAAFGLGAGIVGVVIFAVIMAVIQFVGSFIGAGLYFLSAKHLFGGKGDYGTQYGVTALYLVPLTIIIAIVSPIPCLGALVGLALGLYGMYLLTLALKEVHQLDTMKAVLSWIVPAVVVGIIVGVMVLVLGVALVGMAGLGGLSSLV